MARGLSILIPCLLLTTVLTGQDVPQVTFVNGDPNLASPVDVTRRLYLRLIHRLPNPDETEAFITEADLEALTERLLNSKEHEEALVHFWTDYLQLSTPEDLEWIKSQVAENTPIHRRLHEWFATQEPEPANDEAAFSRMAALSSGLFLEDFTCARCHDHPYERTSLHDLIGLSAFLKQSGTITVPEAASMYIAPKHPLEIARTPKRFGDELTLRISRRESNDAQEPNQLPNREARIKFADWLTHDVSRVRFEKQLVVQYLVWLTGREDWKSDLWRHLNNERFFKELDPWMALWKKHQFDEKAFIREIVQSALFTVNAGEDSFIVPDRMTAHSWRRSLASVLDLPIEENSSVAPDSLYYRRAEYIDSLISQSAMPEKNLSVETLFFNTLGRFPNETEKAAATEASIKDLYWSLLISDEFAQIP